MAVRKSWWALPLTILLSAHQCFAVPPRAPGQSRINPKDGLAYRWIPPGRFLMGCSQGDEHCDALEKPAHRVILTRGFRMADTPVTVAAWKRYRAATGAAALPTADGSGRKDLNEASPDEMMPVVFVTWDEANAFCGWAGMRLPTGSRSGEYAARRNDGSALRKSG